MDLEQGKGVYIQANNFMQDVIENLLFNAIKHNISKKVEVQLSLLKETIDDKQYLKLKLIDNGIGISDDRKTNIFLRETSPTGKGMGLGLSLVKKIIDYLEGDIWVKDRVEGDYTKGSCFTVIIPIAQIY